MPGQEDKKLHVAAIKSLSMVDEPRKSVAVVYLQGCNYQCEFCHNSSLIPMPSEGSNRVDLSKLRDVLYENFLIDGIIFTGGEPTLHPNLLGFVKALSEEYSFIGIDTNGSNPNYLKKLVPYLSRVSMDIKTSLENYEKIVKKKVNTSIIEESIKYLCNSPHESLRVEFRTTYTPPVMDLNDLMAIGELLSDSGFSSGNGNFYVIQQYMPSKGVLKEHKLKFQSVPVDDLVIIGNNLKEYGIPVAIRCQERGYFELE
ncbi:MAG: anaerobic ribonucleoside-triphosphate reductase activating protein [Candidatus Hodarchaeota archaeon]